jgi:helix-turn-helix protein
MIGSKHALRQFCDRSCAPWTRPKPRSCWQFRTVTKASGIPTIAQGISQRELARRLGVHETQVSREERNEYFGITLERAVKILDALNVRLRTQVAIEPFAALPGRPVIMTANSRRRHELIAFGGARRTRTSGDFGPSGR